jgi:hypothetical protein
MAENDQTVVLKGVLAGLQDDPAYAEENWCECDDPETEWQHHSYGLSGVTDKHCWTCKTCKKLTQIG